MGFVKKLTQRKLHLITFKLFTFLWQLFLRDFQSSPRFIHKGWHSRNVPVFRIWVGAVKLIDHIVIICIYPYRKLRLNVTTQKPSIFIDHCAYQRPVPHKIRQSMVIRDYNIIFPVKYAPKITVCLIRTQHVPCSVIREYRYFTSENVFFLYW